MDVSKGKLQQDFFGYYKLLFLLTGLGPSHGIIHKLFKGVLFIGYCYLQVMSLVAAFLAPKELSVLCFHTFLISFFAAYLMTTRTITDKSLKTSRDMILSGIYHYNGEEEGKPEIDSRQYAVYDIRRRTRIVAITYGVLAGYNLVIMPLQVNLFTEDDGIDHSNDVLNKKLPFPMYTPFNSHTFLGYCGGMLMCALYALGGFGGGTAFICIYLSSTLQLKSHLQILNSSIQNIQTRAYMKFLKMGTHAVEKLTEGIYQNKEFQNCMFSCLRANIIHHQTLLRFYKETQPFIGVTFFVLAALGSVSYACVLYLLLQEPPLDLMVLLLLTLFSELAFNYFICYVGQEVIDEAEQLRNSLYSTPWFLCDKRFSQLLGVSMRNMFHPITISSAALNFSASARQFGDATSAMYKIANLVT